MTFNEAKRLLEAKVQTSTVDDKSIRAQCPAHGGYRLSLSVRELDGRLAVKCFSENCERDEIIAAIAALRDGPQRVSERQKAEIRERAERAKEVSRIEFEIRDVDGKLHATHVRIDRADGSKDVYWKDGLGGRSVTSLPLFGSEILKELPADTPLYLTEGEKDAFAMWGQGYAALGTVCGAHSIPDDDVLRCLVGRDVTLWADRDAVGRQHMARIKARLNVLNRKENLHG